MDNELATTIFPKKWWGLDFRARGAIKKRGMQSSSEEVPIAQRGRIPLFSIAVGAIFLLAAVGLGSKALFSDSSQKGAANFLASPQPFEPSLASLAEISSDQMVVAESPELVFIDSMSLLATSPPVTVTPKVLGAILGEAEFGNARKEVVHYVVESGDTIASLAEHFGISVNTILWANDLKQGSALTKGQELTILPVSGTLHLVRTNDTLSEIAVWYKADVEQIVEFNRLSSLTDIFVGDLLLIPDGVMPQTVPLGRLTPIANSYFIYPIPGPHRITQGLHPFNAVDFSNGKCGEPVYAAAGGTVQRTGYHRVGGNYVRILHPNGVVSYYGHLASWTVQAGQKALQGQIIGYTGYSGYTIPAGPGGCHVHFEVRGAVNPFAK